MVRARDSGTPGVTGDCITNRRRQRNRDCRHPGQQTIVAPLRDDAVMVGVQKVVVEPVMNRRASRRHSDAQKQNHHQAG